MRIFQTFVLPDKLVSKFKLSFAAANFSRNLISGDIFDKVYSLIPVNVSGNIDEIDESGYEVVYSKWRLKNKLLQKLSIFAEQWFVFSKISKGDSVWFYNLNFINAYLFALLKIFKPSVKLNVIVLDFTPPSSWKEQNYWFLKIINSADSAIYLSQSKLYKVKHSAVIPGVVPNSKDSNPDIEIPTMSFLLSGVISETISMTLDVLEAFSKHTQYILHITGKVLENEDEIKEYANRYPNIIYHGSMPFDSYLSLLHTVTFQLSTRNPRMPENQYNFPSKIIEALLHNRIIVSTIKYDQLDGVNYLTIDSNNIGKEIQRISQMSEKDLLIYANQADKVKEKFGTDVWEKNIEQLEQSV